MSAADNRNVTMADVAHQAGVSVATVSRALSGNRPMSPDIRSTVLSAADELGYRVNLVGRALRQRRSSTAGLIVPDFDNPFFSSLAQHLSRTFAPSGVDLLVFSADDDLDTELRGVESFIGRQVDALILIPCHEVGSERSITRASESVVTIQLDRQVSSTQAHFVGCDNAHGMRLVHEHVAAHADSNDPVIYVGGDPESSSGHERLEGFRREFGADRLELAGRFDANWGFRAAQKILDLGYESATIVAAADIIALGILSQIQAGGFRVPGDFRVIGFDGVGVSRLAHPTLTTIRQPVEAMSEAILSMAMGDFPTESVRIAPSLVTAESSPTGRFHTRTRSS